MSDAISRYLLDVLPPVDGDKPIPTAEERAYRCETMLLALTASLVVCENPLSKCKFNQKFGPTPDKLCDTHKRYLNQA